jgi:hypothetical protein
MRVLKVKMALKDLIADKGALDEATIERIVRPYVRYDVEAKEIHFTHAFASLSIKAKILVYLVALQGWRFVIDEAMPADARPSDIESLTGIPGGSLRPVLRDLSESHQLSERGSRYCVRSTSLTAVEAALNGGVEADVARGPRRATRQPTRKGATADEGLSDSDLQTPSEDHATKRSEEGDGKSYNRKKEPVAMAGRVRKVSGKTGNVAATFESWIDEGYFNEPRTLSDVQKHFHRHAIMVPQTSLPGYLLGAVRKRRLTRDEVVGNGGKTVWAYKAGPNAKKMAT